MIITKMTFAVILSLIFEISLAIIYFSKKRMDNDENKIYQVLMVSNGIGLLLHLVCDYVSYNYDVIPEVVSIVFLKLLLVYYLLFGVFLLLYLITVTLTTYKHIWVTIISCLGTISTFLIFVLPQNIVIDKKNLIFYTNGLDTKLVFFISGLVIIVMFIMMTIKFHKVEKKKIIPLIIFIALATLSTMVQKSYPDVVITDCMETIIILLMYFTIENPDLKVLQQLEIARRQADRANNAKTEFLSSMSHEIRTPLNAISGFSDCILDAKTLDEAKENAKDIVDASGTLLEIVNGILDISKIEAGKLELSYSSYDSLETFSELAKLISPKMREKGLDFSYYIAPDLPCVLYGDVVNIKKIVTNLLGNSCKYTDKGYVRYEVNCENKNGYSKLIISVEDSGHGIKKDSLENLFTKFQRLDDYKNSTIEGTGLGLAITKQLTELMGGKIIVHSVYGTGSKFTVVINQKIDFENKSIVKDTKKSNIDLHNKKILIVDDNLLNLKVASKLLEKYNANYIAVCNSGFECLEAIEDGNHFDIILLDDMMPKMSGVDTLKKLRKIDGFNTPVVALTANAISGMREKYLKDGFDGYLAKPIEKEELIKILNELLYNTGDSLGKKVENNKKNEIIIIPVENNIEKELGKKLDFTYNTSVMDSLDTSSIDLIPVVDLDEDIVNDEEKYDEDYLKKNGVNLKYALDLLGDMDMYDMTLHDFLVEVEEKWDKIIEYKNSSDMKNYATEVHSLKSDSKYLGLMKLADIAYQHELKSKDNDIDYVNKHFSELENEYNKIIEIIKKYDNSKKMLN